MDICNASCPLLQGLKVIDFQMPDYLTVLENAIQFGNPVLLQNVQEELEPSLNPVLNKSMTRIGAQSTDTAQRGCHELFLLAERRLLVPLRWQAADEAG